MNKLVEKAKRIPGQQNVGAVCGVHGEANQVPRLGVHCLRAGEPLAGGRPKVYTKYIGTPPRAERLGRHGLFGGKDTVDLEKAMTDLLPQAEIRAWHELVGSHYADLEYSLFGSNLEEGHTS